VLPLPAKTVNRLFSIRGFQSPMACKLQETA
jgi:hypothetical protein